MYWALLLTTIIIWTHQNINLHVCEHHMYVNINIVMEYNMTASMFSLIMVRLLQNLIWGLLNYNTRQTQLT